MLCRRLLGHKEVWLSELRTFGVNGCHGYKTSPLRPVTPAEYVSLSP